MGHNIKSERQRFKWFYRNKFIDILETNYTNANIQFLIKNNKKILFQNKFFKEKRINLLSKIEYLNLVKTLMTRF